MLRRRATALFAAMATLGLGATVVQAADQGSSQPSPPQAVKPLDRNQQRGQRPGSGSSTQQDGQSLSNELSRSGGVIQPPATVDPGITKPPPNLNQNSTPVIPPPGTPENQPHVKPK
jgi:hypothetical protein